MFEQALAIIRNTFFESIRQPILLALLIPSALLILLSNPFSAYTMGDDQRMYIDIGLSTIFISGAVTAAFIATSVLTREIENKTVLSVIAKPVGRPVFLISKFIGVAGALLVAMLLLSLVFLLVEMHGVRQTVRTPYHLPVIFFTLGAAVIGAIIGIWCNIFYNRSFVSSVICAWVPLLALAYILSLLFGHDFTPQPIWVAFKGQFWLALICLAMALLVLTAIAVAISTRLGQVMTLSVTIGLFLLGLLSDWLFARPMDDLQNKLDRLNVDSATASHTGDLALLWFYKFAYAVTPNIQVLWLADALTQKSPIPLSYVASTLIYGSLFIVAALCIGVILFQRREVG